MGLFVANKSFMDALNICCAVLRTRFGSSEKSSSSAPTFNKIKKFSELLMWLLLFQFQPVTQIRWACFRNGTNHWMTWKASNSFLCCEEAGHYYTAATVCVAQEYVWAGEMLQGPRGTVGGVQLTWHHTRGVKHKAWWPEKNHQRLQFGPLDSFWKCPVLVKEGINFGLLTVCLRNKT